MTYKKNILLLCILSLQSIYAKTFHLFLEEMKRENPSIVYDFLERYLYKMDSLQKRRVNVAQRLKDDKVNFIVGKISTARSIREDMKVVISKIDNRYYEVVWEDSLKGKVLDITFPMQYELLWGMPKVDIEKGLKETLLQSSPNFVARNKISSVPTLTKDSSCYEIAGEVYYMETMSTSSYFFKSKKNEFYPIFSEKDKAHSAANLFQGFINRLDNYTLFIQQNLYNFQTMQYSVPLSQWLSYCKAMKLKVFFCIEEEREDGLKALLIAKSEEFGFNHILSILLPVHFTEDKKCVIKCTLNAYVPMQNVKNLYQQYVEKPKKVISE